MIIGDGTFSTAEKNDLIMQEPLSEKYIQPFLGAEEFINAKERWCLWFADKDLAQLNKDLQEMPLVAKRLEGVKQMRQSSKKTPTQKLASTLHLFGEIRQPSSKNYLLIPSVSSEERDFIPIGFIDSLVINSNANFSC